MLSTKDVTNRDRQTVRLTDRQTDREVGTEGKTEQERMRVTLLQGKLSPSQNFMLSIHHFI